MEGSRIVGTAQMVDVVPPRSAVYTDPSTAMDVKVSPAARAFIHERGGRLFIWTESFGRAWLRVKASPSPPQHAVDFDEWIVAGLRLCLERGPFELRYFRIGLRRFPRRKLVVTTGMVVPQ